jgi:hypothetical protein
MHSPFAPLHLGILPSRRAVEAGQVPDRIVTIGRKWREIFLERGLRDEAVSPGPALRFESIPDSLREQRSRGNVVLVTTSIDPGDALELVTKTLLALGGERDVRVLVKLHPKMPGLKGFLDLVRRGFPAHVELTTEPIPQLLEKTRVLLYTATGVVYEALARGIAVVSVSSDLLLDMDKLGWFPGSSERVRTPEELGRAVRALLAEDEDAGRARVARTRLALEQTFAPPGEDPGRVFLRTREGQP